MVMSLEEVRREPLLMERAALAVQIMRIEFERCWPWLEASLAEYGPTHGKEDVWQRIETGKAFLFPGERCAILGEVVVTPKLKSFNEWLQGGDLREIIAKQPEVEAFARYLKCDRLIACGRRGWLRALVGWRELGTRRAKNLC